MCFSNCHFSSKMRRRFKPILVFWKFRENEPWTRFQIFWHLILFKRGESANGPVMVHPIDTIVLYSCYRAWKTVAAMCYNVCHLYIMNKYYTWQGLVKYFIDKYCFTFQISTDSRSQKLVKWNWNEVWFHGKILTSWTTSISRRQNIHI